MNEKEFYRSYSSDCAAGSANQVLAREAGPAEHTGRCYYRLSNGGKNYALLFSNLIDSTFDDGSISVANDCGGEWEIRSMRVGLCSCPGEEPEQWRPVTFGGEKQKRVSGPETFCTDPIPLGARAGQFLCYEITFFGSCFPYHAEIWVSALLREGEVFRRNPKFPVPLMIGSDRPVFRKIGFLGDSITQGCSSEKVDSYAHWVAKVTERLPEQVSVWDLGIGFARACDAATDGCWLNRAKYCDAVNVCFGVNDLLRGRTAEQLIGDLTVILERLSAAGCKTVLCTVPPFDLAGQQREYWYRANEAIRSDLGRKADAVFDIAAVLGQPEPLAYLTRYGGHPNAEGCRAVAAAYPIAALL